ncbi:hypothetical protein UO65_4941 [Actinokineospora spheciospongiae]|uniref:Lipoprotein n=1 Tax=Actinokineospora spheciospongiae TaxID=909613 RepID=W7IHK4_9PSEU|nr:hypothetical protein [Actinokineospora spheciospongiae]EWC59798.1 hypothetical protein UO65_4941 [Actinokineospora spheciospongiae]
MRSAGFRLCVAVAAPIVLLAGCTTHPGDVGAGTAATVVVPAAPTTVLDVAAGPGAAIAVSAALFRRSPVVVVSTEGDAAGAMTASAVAERLGVPMLVFPRAAANPPDAPLGRELARLAPDTVLAVGTDGLRAALERVGPAPVLTVAPGAGGAEQPTDLPDDLPVTKRPQPVDLTVLVDTTHTDTTRTDTAAATTARAAGARVVTVRGTDPRADPDTIAALRAHPPTTVLALGGGFGPASRLRARLDTATRADQLPGGGQVLLPGRRLVCLYGHPGSPALGALGEQGVERAIDRVKELAADYAPLSDVPVVPAFEIIATVAQGSPGADGDYSGESGVEKLRPWVERAGEAGLYVLLDLQPGRADLVAQARRYEPLLRLPHVGLAVDPEWKLGPDQLPLEQIGGVDAEEVNRTTAWLADLTAAHGLPQKLFVLHQFRLSMIRDEADLDTGHDELAMVIHMDGQGSTGQKSATWRLVVRARPEGVAMGWKNFYDEDQPLLSPEQTMAYEPTPLMISYQ